MEVLGRLSENVVAAGPRVITAAHPAAAAAGATAFAQGGNAFDAALAACFMETVALPMKCGLAGDLVALYRRENGNFETLVSVGPGPSALAEGATLERVGPRSVGVPGAPHGYATLHGFARLGLDRLVAPAVRAAEEGIAWTRVALSYLVEAEELLDRVSPRHPYSPGGRRPQPGDVRRLPGLGRLLQKFAALGADLFAGEEGEKLVAELRARGGILSIKDLQARPATIAAPVVVTIREGTRLLATPAPTGGPRLGEVVLRTARTNAPLSAIVHAERNENKARGRQPQDCGTSVVTAADDMGNAVVIVHSNSFPRFGSGVVLESGLVLNNRPGRGFDLTAPPGARNAPAAGRVPETTLHAWALESDRGLFVGATPGGVNQLPWNAQCVTEILAGAEIGAAVTNPRWALDERDEMSVEEGAVIRDETPVRRVPWLSLRSVQQILQVAKDGHRRAAADPRTGALALAVY